MYMAAVSQMYSRIFMNLHLRWMLIRVCVLGRCLAFTDAECTCVLVSHFGPYGLSFKLQNHSPAQIWWTSLRNFNENGFTNNCQNEQPHLARSKTVENDELQFWGCGENFKLPESVCKSNGTKTLGPYPP